jgi:predicted amidohydrolase
MVTPAPENPAVTVRVVCCQIAPHVGELAYNRHLCAQAIRDAARDGAQLVVLPELVQSGYVFADKAEALSLSEPVDGPTLREWQQLAHTHNLVLVAGFCEQLDGDRLSNSAVLIDPTGVRAVYRKAHLWDQEKRIFTPGQVPPPVIQTLLGRIGMVICYDLEFPEWVRLVALQGAQLLCVPTNWPDGGRPAGERPSEVVRVQANAAFNRLFIAASSRCGTERGVPWVGGSVIVDCNGYPVSGPLGPVAPGAVWASLQLSDADNKWISANNHVLNDRRPGLYETTFLTNSMESL